MTDAVGGWLFERKAKLFRVLVVVARLIREWEPARRGGGVGGWVGMWATHGTDRFSSSVGRTDVLQVEAPWYEQNRMAAFPFPVLFPYYARVGGRLSNIALVQIEYSKSLYLLNGIFVIQRPGDDNMMMWRRRYSSVGPLVSFSSIGAPNAMQLKCQQFRIFTV